jgi:hypothetical protein
MWNQSQFRVFISHSSKDQRLAGQLKEALSELAIDGFVAHADIYPTREWQKEILQALETCEALIALLTRSFRESDWTDQEVGYCLKRGILIIPIIMDEAPYGFIARYQAIRGGRKTPEQIARLIFDSLVLNERAMQRMLEAMIEQFEKSNSFDQAKRNMTLLERFPDSAVLGDEQAERLIRAIESNRQISEAYGVPDRVISFIQSHPSQ